MITEPAAPPPDAPSETAVPPSPPFAEILFSLPISVPAWIKIIPPPLPPPLDTVSVPLEWPAPPPPPKNIFAAAQFFNGLPPSACRSVTQPVLLEFPPPFPPADKFAPPPPPLL